MPHCLRRGTRLLAVAALATAASHALGAPPGEVSGVLFGSPGQLVWDPTAGAQDYNVYRGDLGDLRDGKPPTCHGDEIVTTSFATPAVPASGAGYAYLVTAENASDEEGTPGSDSTPVERETLGQCDAVMFHHVLQRLGYGWNEWNRDRLQTLGYGAYRDEQLDPTSIDESGNTDLNFRRNQWTPPDNEAELQYLLIENSIYSWRQLEWQTTEFWINHFNTEFFKTYNYIAGFYLDNSTRFFETAKLHDLETERLRGHAFHNNFREILEASALNPPMMIYLDAHLNTALRPNENFAREILELHAQGVDKGYNEDDVRELTRVFTGWSVCKKALTDIGDPLAPCVDPIFGPISEWTAHYNPAEHDTGQKVLYAGTPQELIIPDTSADPILGVDDVYLALDAIADHPATAEFISTKLLQRFVTETPTQAMIDAVVLEWNDGGHPNGKGDLREVLRAVLDPANILDPDHVGQKVKTPHEQIVSAYRAMRGKTNVFNMPFVRNWIFRIGQLHYLNPVPTGYSEIGGDWLNTNALLDRQDSQMVLSTDGFYGGEITQLVNENGLTTAELIVDFFADTLFGGAWTPFERQQALDYLNTDDNGVPSPYDDARVRELVGFMMGFKQFMEQ